jgi:hypothetical protein
MDADFSLNPFGRNPKGRRTKPRSVLSLTRRPSPPAFSLPGLRAGFPRFCEKRVALRRLSTFLAPFSEKGRSGCGAWLYPGRRCGRGILRQAGVAGDSCAPSGRTGEGKRTDGGGRAMY